MSTKAISAVWEHSRSKGAARLVLLAIADHAGMDGTGAWPRYDRLEMFTKVSERGIRDAIKELTDVLQELVVGEHPDDRRRNTYSVRLPGLRAYEEIPAVSAGNESGVASRARDQGKRTPNRGSEETPAETAGNDEEENRQSDVAIPAVSDAITGSSARAYKEEPSGTKGNLPVGAADAAPEVDRWNAGDVLTAVIKPGEHRTIPSTLRSRLGAELRKLAADEYDFETVCAATRRVIDEHKTPTALPLILMDLIHEGKQGRGRGHEPWRSPGEKAYAGPVR